MIRDLVQPVNLLRSESRRDPIDRMSEVLALLQSAAAPDLPAALRAWRTDRRRGASPIVGAGNSKRSSRSRTSARKRFASRSASDKPMSSGVPAARDART